MSEPRVERSEANVRFAPPVIGPPAPRRDVVVSVAVDAAGDPRPATALVGFALLRPKTPLALPEHRSDVTWRSVATSLFGKGVRSTDLRAGAIDDCYFIAALCAIAAMRPEWLTEIIGDEVQGAGVTARFFDLDSGAPVRVSVAKSLPVRERDRRPVYAASSASAWGPLAEKTYAAYYGGYERIGRQGVAAYALRELTGFTTRTYRPTVDGVAATYEAMATAARERRPMVAETTARNFSGCNVSPQGLVAGHSYAVLDVAVVSGVRWVTLQEPAASEEFRSTSYDSDAAAFAGARVRRGDGVFRMRFDDFALRFPSVVVITNERLRLTGAPAATSPPPTHFERAGALATPGPLVCNLRT